MNQYIPQATHSLAIIYDLLEKQGCHDQIAQIRALIAAEPSLAGLLEHMPTSSTTRQADSTQPKVPENAVKEIDFLVEFLSTALARTRRLAPAHGNKSADERALYCLCQKPSKGDMVACDNKNCSYEWFHLGCLNMTKFPQGKWYCPACRETMGL